MYLSGLPRVLESAGVDYTIIDGAETRSAYDRTFIEIRAQMFHTTESRDSVFASGRDAPTLAYVVRGLGYPLYNLLYGRSGHVYLVACGPAAHAGKGSGFGMPANRGHYYSIAHSADANQSKYPITEAQLISMVKVAHALNQDWPSPRTTVMHGQWAPARRSDPTKVPGGWAALARAIDRGSWTGGGSSSGAKPASSSSSSSSSSGSKSISQMATEVIAGQHGSGHANRRRSLGVNASTYEKVRAEVNRRAGVGSVKGTIRGGSARSISQMATEVINGKHGSGHANRRRSLGVSADTYAKVRAEVNRRAGGGGSSSGRSISRMATEVLQGKHGTGHAQRRRSLGINASTYARVRAEVNRRA